MSIERKLAEVQRDKNTLDSLKQNLKRCKETIDVLSGKRLSYMEGEPWGTISIGIGCKDDEPYNFQFSTGTLDQSDVDALLSVARHTQDRLEKAIDAIEEQYRNPDEPLKTVEQLGE